MTVTRRNVWELGDDWADDILWYARGVAAMKSRPLAEPTSWRFYAGIHGFDVARWQQLGALTASDQPPSQALLRRHWVQCQHGSWYFLPWHRGYVLAFEANIRAAVVALGGPQDWALPYWNYFKSGQSGLPPAFGSPSWPDGAADNPLFVTQRYGPYTDGTVEVPLSAVNLKAMADPVFTGVASGGSPGFGGVDTGFAHGGAVHGGIESQPHDWVHGLVGGADPADQTLLGAMSDPRTAGLDPIFWLHHANIDRLWESWNRARPTNVNPTDPPWVHGPASVGQREFVAPWPDGSEWTYTPGDMVDIVGLGYQYDDLAPGMTPPPPPPIPVPAEVGPVEVGAAQGGLAEAAMASDETRGAAMPDETDVEMMGASRKGLTLRGTGATSKVALDPEMRRKSLRRMAAFAGSDDAPAERVYLNLEHVTGKSDAAAFQVYVGVPDEADPEHAHEALAGSIAPFGLSQASDPDGESAGEGLTFVLDVTDIVGTVYLDSSFDVDDLEVRIEPLRPIQEAAQISIGRISMFRQGG